MADDPDTRAGPAPDPSPGDPGRPITTIRAELADLDRYLATTPPHTAGELSRGIVARRDTLQRELARALARSSRSTP